MMGNRRYRSIRVQGSPIAAPAGCEVMERRLVLSSFIVTSTATAPRRTLCAGRSSRLMPATGPGSISFDIPGDGVQMIALSAAAACHHESGCDRWDVSTELFGLAADPDRRLGAARAGHRAALFSRQARARSRAFRSSVSPGRALC